MANALNTSAVLTQEFVDLLAAELLPRPDDNYPFYVNGPIQSMDDLTKVPGETILFDRPQLPTGSYDEVSRRGAEGTDISNRNQTIVMDQVSATIREYLGPHDGTDIAPFGITEFLAKRASHDLLGIIGGFLRRDRVKVLDTWARDAQLAATTVITPDGSAEGAITAGQAASAAWLRKLGKAMIDNKIPSYNGRYRLWITSRHNEELLADTEFREANRYLPNNPAFTGHVKTFDMFDIGIATNIPTKAVGAGGAVTGYQAIAHGPLGLGHGTAMGVIPAADTQTDFGRRERVIWKSHEAFATLMSDFLVRGLTS